MIKERLTFIDSAKFYMILLMVFCHCLSGYNGSEIFASSLLGGGKRCDI